MPKKIIGGVLLTAAALLFLPFRMGQALALSNLIIILFSFAWSLAARTSLTAERELKTVRNDAYHAVSLVTILKNSSRIPFPGIKYADSAPDLFFSTPPTALLHFPGKREITISSRLQGYRRGIYQAGPMELSGSDPLGLFPWKKQLPHTEVSVVIYPEIIPLSKPFSIHRGMIGGSSRTTDKAYEDVSRYLGLRDYQPGDPFRIISWKASAHRGKLQSMDYERTIHAPAWVVLETSRDAYPERHREAWIERAISAAASICTAYGAMGQPIGLLCSGSTQTAETANSVDRLTERDKSPSSQSHSQSHSHHLPLAPPPLLLQPGAGNGQMEAILSLLASISPAPTKALRTLLESFMLLRAVRSSHAPVSPAREKIFYIGPTLVDDDRARLLFLRNTGTAVDYHPIASRFTRLTWDTGLTSSGIRIAPLVEYGPDLFRETPQSADSKEAVP